MNDLFQEFYEAVKYGFIETAEELLAENPDLIEMTDEQGFNAIHVAAGELSIQMLELLIENGADVTSENDEGLTPLHLASYPEIAECLISHGADINKKSNKGETPLFTQTGKGEEAYEVVEYLLIVGADKNIADNSGRTPLDLARGNKEYDLVRLLE